MLSQSAGLAQHYVERLAHGDLVIFEAAQSSTAYEVQWGDDQAGPSIAFLALGASHVGQVPKRGPDPRLFQVVEQGEWLGLRSPLLEGLFLQARKKAPHLVFFSTRLGVWEQWKVEPLYQGALQHHSPALCLTHRQVPSVTLTVRAWKVGAVPQEGPPPRAAVSPRHPPLLDTGHGFTPDQSPGRGGNPRPGYLDATAGFPDPGRTHGGYSDAGGSPDPSQPAVGAGYAASVSSSLQDDALELSHNVLKGYIARVLKWPLYLAFRVWRAEARTARRRRAEAAAHHERWLQSTAWAAMQHRAANERHERHMMVLACQCWARHRAQRLARTLQAWHSLAAHSAALERLCKVCRRKAAWRRAAAVLAAWGRYSQERRSRQLVLEGAQTLLGTLRVRDALRRWQQAAAAQRAAISAFQQHQLRRLLHATVAHWHGLTSRLAAAHHAVNAYLATAAAAALAAILRAWHLASSQRRQLALRQRLLLAARARRALGSAWCAWRSLADDSAARRRRTEVLLLIRHQQLAGRVLRRWATITGEAAVLRFAADHLAACRERRLLPRAFAAWRAVAALESRLLEGEQGEASEQAARLMGILRRRLVADQQAGLARRVFAGWRQLAASSLQRSVTAAAASRARARAFTRAVWFAWRGWPQSCANTLLRFLEARSRALLQRVTRAWRGVAIRGRQLGAVEAVVRRRRRRRLLRALLSHWQQELACSLEAWDRACGAWSQGLTRRALGAWRQCCAVTGRAVAVLGRCRGTYERQLLGRALHALRHRVVVQWAVRGCRQRAAAALARRVVDAWQRRAAYIARLHRFGSGLQSRWRSCVARGVMRCWFLASKAASLQLQLLQAMRAGAWDTCAGEGGALATTAAALLDHLEAGGGSGGVQAGSVRGGKAAVGKTFGQQRPFSGAAVARAAMEQSPPAHTPESLPSHQHQEPGLLRTLSVSLGNASTDGGARGGAAARQSVLDLLHDRLPSLARLAARPRQRVLAILRVWRAVAAAKRGRQDLATRLTRRVLSLRLGDTFRAWRASTVDIRTRRSAAMSIAKRAVRLLAVTCLAAWQRSAQRSARLRRTCVALLSRRTARLRVAVLVAWRAEVRAVRAKVREVQKVKWDARYALMDRAWRSWLLAVEVTAAAREAAERRHTATWKRLKRQVLAGWRQVVVFQEQHLTTCIRLVRTQADRRLQKLVLSGWGSFARQERQRREDWPQLCRVFFAWRTLVQPAGRAAKAAEAKLAKLGLDSLRSSRAGPLGIDPSGRSAAAPGPAPGPASAPGKPGEPKAKPGLTQAAAGGGDSSSGVGPSRLARWGSHASAATVDASAQSSDPEGVVQEADGNEEEEEEPQLGAGAKARGSEGHAFGPFGPLVGQAGPGALSPASFLWQQWYQLMQAGGVLRGGGGGPGPMPLGGGGWGVAASCGVAGAPAEQERSGGEAEALRERLANLEAELKQHQRERDQEAAGSGAGVPAAARPLFPPPALAQSPSSNMLTASCRPEPGPTYQLRQSIPAIPRATSRTSLAQADSEDGGAAADNTPPAPLLPPPSAAAGAPAGVHTVAASASTAPKAAPVYPPSAAPPPPPVLAPTASWKVQSASCRPEPGPRYQVREGSVTTVGRVSTAKSLAVGTIIEPSDLVISEVSAAASAGPATATATASTAAGTGTGAGTASTAPALLAGSASVPATPVKDAAVADAAAAGAAASSPPGPTTSASSSPPTAASGRSYKSLTASVRPEPGPLYQVREGSTTSLGRASLRSLSSLKPLDSTVSSVVAAAADPSSVPAANPAAQPPGSPASPAAPSQPSSSSGQSSGQGAAPQAVVAEVPTAAPPPPPPPPRPAPLQSSSSRVLTASCHPEPGSLYQINHGSSTTVGRASSRSLSASGLDPSDSTTTSGPPGSFTTAAPQPPPQTLHIVIQQPHFAATPLQSLYSQRTLRRGLSGGSGAASGPPSSSAAAAEEEEGGDSSSLGSPTSLQAWSRRTTADLSAPSEGGGDPANDPRRSTADLVLLEPGGLILPGGAEAAGAGLLQPGLQPGHKGQQPPLQQQKRWEGHGSSQPAAGRFGSGGGGEADDVLLQAASRLLQGVCARGLPPQVMPSPAMLPLPLPHAPGGQQAGGQQSGRAAHPESGNVQGGPQPQQQQQQPGAQQAALIALPGGQVAQVLPAPPPPFQQQQQHHPGQGGADTGPFQPAFVPQYQLSANGPQRQTPLEPQPLSQWGQPQGAQYPHHPHLQPQPQSHHLQQQQQRQQIPGDDTGAPSQVAAALRVPLSAALTPAAPDMQDLDALLGELEARSRSAMSSPKRPPPAPAPLPPQSHHQPHPLLGPLRRPATESSASAATSSSGLGLGLHSLDRIDSLHVRATTLSAPGSSIIGTFRAPGIALGAPVGPTLPTHSQTQDHQKPRSGADAAAGVYGGGGGGAQREPVGYSTGVALPSADWSGDADMPRPGTVADDDPVEAALRRLEAAGMQTHVFAAAGGPAATPTAHTGAGDGGGSAGPGAGARLGGRPAKHRDVGGPPARPHAANAWDADPTAALARQQQKLQQPAPAQLLPSSATADAAANADGRGLIGARALASARYLPPVQAGGPAAGHRAAAGASAASLLATFLPTAPGSGRHPVTAVPGTLGSGEGWARPPPAGVLRPTPQAAAGWLLQHQSEQAQQCEQEQALAWQGEGDEGGYGAVDAATEIARPLGDVSGEGGDEGREQSVSFGLAPQQPLRVMQRTQGQGLEFWAQAQQRQDQQQQPRRDVRGSAAAGVQNLAPEVAAAAGSGGAMTSAAEDPDPDKVCPRCGSPTRPQQQRWPSPPTLAPPVALSRGATQQARQPHQAQGPPRDLHDPPRAAPKPESAPAAPAPRQGAAPPPQRRQYGNAPEAAAAAGHDQGAQRGNTSNSAIVHGGGGDGYASRPPGVYPSQQQQQQQPEVRWRAAPADPLAEVAQLAKRRGNLHLAAMLTDLAGEARREIAMTHGSATQTTAAAQLLDPGRGRLPGRGGPAVQREEQALNHPRPHSYLQQPSSRPPAAAATAAAAVTVLAAQNHAERAAAAADGAGTRADFSPKLRNPNMEPRDQRGRGCGGDGIRHGGGTADAVAKPRPEPPTAPAGPSPRDPPVQVGGAAESKARPAEELKQPVSARDACCRDTTTADAGATTAAGTVAVAARRPAPGPLQPTPRPAESSTASSGTVGDTNCGHGSGSGSGNSSSESSSSCGDGPSSTVCEAVVNGFDPDPLHSPLRHMLGECHRLQDRAERLEEHGDAVVREVVSGMSPRGAVVAALTAVLQHQQQVLGGGAPSAGVAGGRRILTAGRRL